MEQKATQEKMIAEYRTWFAIFLKCLSEIKVDAQIKAEYTEEYRHKLTGMLVLMNGMKVITGIRRCTQKNDAAYRHMGKSMGEPLR